MERVNELLAEIKAAIKEQREKDNSQVLKVFAIIGIIAAIVIIAFVLYRFLTPDYYEDYDDNVYDDEYEDVPIKAAADDTEPDDED